MMAVLGGEQRMGIQTVFNIRRATEDGYVDLQKEFEEQGIAYERCPVDYREPNEKDVDHLLGNKFSKEPSLVTLT